MPSRFAQASSGGGTTDEPHLVAPYAGHEAGQLAEDDRVGGQESSIVARPQR